MYGSVVPRVSVRPGDVLVLREGDYKYGHGELALRVARVRLDISLWYDGEWVWIEGTPITWDGSPAGTRSVLARVAALRTLAA